MAEPADSVPPLPTFPFDGGCPRLELHPLLDRLRRERSVARVPLGDAGEAWLVTTYDEVRRVLQDETLFSRAAAEGLPGYPRLDGLILALDGAEHDRVRGVANRAFTPRRVETLRPRIAATSRALVDALLAQDGPADLAGAYAFPLSMAAICDLLGAPEEDRHRFGHWGEAFLSNSSMTAAEAGRARGELGMYIAGLVADRRAAPRDDLIGELVTASDRGSVLAEQELLMLILALLVGGFETSAGQISIAALYLAGHPDVAAHLREHPERVPAAAEQLLQHHPVSSDALMPRRYVGTEPLDFGGAVVRPGDIVIPSQTSANRDETAFPGQSEGPDVGRDPDPARPSMTFGWGPHYCIGANLARLELQIAIGDLLACPALRLAVPEADLRWKEHTTTRGLLELPVHLR